MKLQELINKHYHSCAIAVASAYVLYLSDRAHAVNRGGGFILIICRLFALVLGNKAFSSFIQFIFANVYPNRFVNV